MIRFTSARIELKVSRSSSRFSSGLGATRSRFLSAFQSFEAIFDSPFLPTYFNYGDWEECGGSGESSESRAQRELEVLATTILPKEFGGGSALELFSFMFFGGKFDRKFVLPPD